jgi:protein NrfD
MADGTGWTGATYYGRRQLKSAPFNVWIVGGYIFVAGLSGSANLLSLLADANGWDGRGKTGRSGRYISLLAPILGAPLLILDLHTPQRFYNMLRVAKWTSPMSIGTWILMAFTGSAFASAGAEALSRRLPWMGGVARVTQVPAALSGAGLSIYTASLLSATSTPAWVAAPRALAIRFAGSSVAAAAALLALLEPDRALRRRLHGVAAVALGVELVATAATEAAYKEKGIAAVGKSGWGRTEAIAVTGLGVALPLALLTFAACSRSPTARRLGTAGAVAAIGGSFLLRVATLGVGDVSADRPDLSFPFSQPENLPDKQEGASIREKLAQLMRSLRRRA